MNRFLKIGLGAGALVLVAGGALLTLGPQKQPKAQRSVERGHALASEYCARCHAIAGPGPSPVADAPPFSGFAQRWPLENLEESLAEGIMAGHEKYQMPVFQFTPGQIDDFIDYLRTVQLPAHTAPIDSNPPAKSPAGH